MTPSVNARSALRAGPWYIRNEALAEGGLPLTTKS